MTRRCSARCITQKKVAAVFVSLLVYGTFRMILSDLGNVEDDTPDAEIRMRRLVSHNASSAKSPAIGINVHEQPRLKSKLWKAKSRYMITWLQQQQRRPLQTSNCASWFGDTFKDNLRVISNYPRGVADTYLEQIGGKQAAHRHQISKFPVIVTAANSGFYTVAQGLLKSVHELLIPKYGNITIVFYDMGLTDAQFTELKQYCRCDVRRFPFEDFPGHVKQLKTYAWKPLIIKTLLVEFGFVWWMDSSVRFVTSDLDSALDYSRRQSILFFTYGTVFSVAQHTDQQTMRYLNEDTCKFRSFGEIEATFVLFHYDDVTNVVVNAWAACALNENCISPPGTANKLSCVARNKADGRCHRFDQAVLSILLRRLYHEQNDYPLVETPFHIHVIMRGNGVSYFQSLRSTQIALRPHVRGDNRRTSAGRLSPPTSGQS